MRERLRVQALGDVGLTMAAPVDAAKPDALVARIQDVAVGGVEGLGEGEGGEEGEKEREMRSWMT